MDRFCGKLHTAVTATCRERKVSHAKAPGCLPHCCRVSSQTQKNQSQVLPGVSLPRGSARCGKRANTVGQRLGFSLSRSTCQYFFQRQGVFSEKASCEGSCSEIILRERPCRRLRTACSWTSKAAVWLRLKKDGRTLQVFSQEVHLNRKIIISSTSLVVITLQL